MFIVVTTVCTKTTVVKPATVSSTSIETLKQQPFPVTVTCSEPIVNGRVSVKYGTNIYFYAAPSGPGYSYKWVVSGEAFLWAQGSTLGFTCQQPGLVTPVYVIVYDSLGRSSQSVVTKVKWTLR